VEFIEKRLMMLALEVRALEELEIKIEIWLAWTLWENLLGVNWIRAFDLEPLTVVGYKIELLFEHFLLILQLYFNLIETIVA
jgi:hypothetical protein